MSQSRMSTENGSIWGRSWGAPDAHLITCTLFLSASLSKFLSTSFSAIAVYCVILFTQHRTSSLSCFWTATIDSTTNPNPQRDRASSSPSLVALESSHLAPRSPAPTPSFPFGPGAQIDSTVASLVPATRSRSELEQGSSTDPTLSSTSGSFTFVIIFSYHIHLIYRTPRFLLLILHLSPDSEYSRARKRQRFESSNPSLPSSRTTSDPSTSTPSRRMMKLSEFDESSLSDALDSSTHAGPSSLGGGLDGFPSSNGTNGHTNGFSNGINGTSAGSTLSNGVSKPGKAISKIILPGTTLYDDSFVDREEFIRLVIQSLRDVGYMYVHCFAIDSLLLTPEQWIRSDPGGGVRIHNGGTWSITVQTIYSRWCVAEGRSCSDAAWCTWRRWPLGALTSFHHSHPPWHIEICCITGSQVSDKPAEISWVAGSKETYCGTPSATEWTCIFTCWPW